MPLITLFKNISSTENPEYTDLITFIEAIRDGEWEDISVKCRSIKDKEEQKRFKASLPTASMSGKFKRRSDAELIEHNNFLIVEFDDLENINQARRLLSNDKYVAAFWMSVGGYGARAMFKIDGEKHRQSFYGVAKYLLDNYGLQVDTNGVNVSKPYIVSFDPNLYLSPDIDNVPVFKKYLKEQIVKKIDYVDSPEDFRSVITQIKLKNINICEEYINYLKVGFALSEEFGENGRSYYHDLSSISQKYKPKEVDRQYDYCLKAKGSSRANIASFFYLAKINGVNITTERTRTIISVTKNGKRAGLSKNQICENLKKFSSIDNSEDIVDKIFESDDGAGFEDENFLEQLEMFISSNYSLQMNEVTGYLEQGGNPLSPSELNSIFISAKKVIPKLDYQLMIRLLKSEFTPCYNPFFKFFDSDGIPTILPANPVVSDKEYPSPLIDLLCDTIINDDKEYTRIFIKKWIVSIISAAHKVHSPLLLCLLGKVHGTGKSEWFRRLLPKELQNYYAESKLDKEKDDELLMTENLVIMDDELGGKSKRDNIVLKNITSRQYFYIRRPYGDHNEKILRLAVLCGTSNYMDILTDDTGNRRILPIPVLDIDKKLFNSIDKRELFFEAYKLYRDGFDWRVNPEDVKKLSKESHKYEAISSEKELLERYFAPGNDDRLTTTDIRVELEMISRQKLNAPALGRYLEHLGFERKTTREPNGSTPKKWMIKRIGRRSSALPIEDEVNF